MGNENSEKENKNNEENKTEFILTNNIIMDIIIFYNYEKKYESISNEMLDNNKKTNNNYIYIVCGLINGFIEIYNIYNNKFKLSISFKAHRDLISKIIQLRKSGYLLTSSFDNSLKIFKLSNNCNKETLIYIFYLNIIFNRINDIIEMSFNNNIIISVMNNIINFPINKNILSEEKNNLSDYYYSKYEHQKNYLNNLLEINNDILVSLDDINDKLLFFKLFYTEEKSDDITLIKTIKININNYNKTNINFRNNFEKKKYIESLKPKYNCILILYNYSFIIIDIKYLEIVSFFEIKTNMNSFLIYHKNYDKIFLLNKKYVYKYKINNNNNNIFEIEKVNKKNVNIDYIINLNEVQKFIFSPLNENKIFVFYKKILMTIDLFNF